MPCTALAEASIIVREHTPPTNLFMCLWFNEVVRFTSRDQLSFPYVLWRLNIPGLNMFPVCSRKDLGNSMGHRREVRPLVRTKRWEGLVSYNVFNPLFSIPFACCWLHRPTIPLIVNRFWALRFHVSRWNLSVWEECYTIILQFLSYFFSHPR